MTEAEWRACAEPKRMLASLFARTRKTAATDERFRRFGIACCRRVAEVLESGDTHALDCLEVYATSRLREALLKARRAHRSVGNEASHAMSRSQHTGPVTRLRAQAGLMATSAVWSCTKTKPSQTAMAYHEAAIAAATIKLAASPIPAGHRFNQWLPPAPAELAAQAALLRCIFGNPFRPTAFAPEWCTDTALAIARGMYDTRDFGAMPILADALQDAGCDNPDILNHCRDDRLHVPGCWVVSGVLSMGQPG